MLDNHPSLEYINFILQTGIQYILCNKGQLFVLILDLLPSISARNVKYSKWQRRSMRSEVLDIHCSNVNTFLSIEVNCILKLKTT